MGADGSQLSYNLFTYCSNNPITGYDPCGTINWGNILKAAAVVVVITAIVAATVATAGAAAVAAGAISASVSTAATTGAVIGGLAAGTSEVVVQCATRGSENLDFVSIGIETFVGSAHGAMDGASATLTSAGKRLACKGGKVFIGAIGSVSHSVNQGKNVQETLNALAGSVGASVLLQSSFAAKDYLTGQLNTTLLEQAFVDGGLSYGTMQYFSTAAIRIISNLFRNKQQIIEEVF